MVLPVDALLPLLRCPRSGEVLLHHGAELAAVGGGRYPIVNGKPILLLRPEEVMLQVSPDRVSRNIPEYEVAPRFAAARRVLHLGSGNVPCRDPRVVSADVLPLENVDVVCEAEHLPFADACFDYVESGATFEHVYDPLRAIAEVKRVLVPGGHFYIDTAFLQSYHGFPSHYFNLTPQAIEARLVDDFVLEEARVPIHATPAVAIRSLVERLLSYAPEAQRRELLGGTLEAFLAILEADPTPTGQMLRGQSEYALRSMAASFAVVARKPIDYEATKRRLDEQGLTEAWGSAKRRYYEARMEVIQRHHEVALYRRWVLERGHGAAAATATEADDGAAGPLDAALMRGHLADPLSPEAVLRATALLQEDEARLRALRDGWIARYLEPR